MSNELRKRGTFVSPSGVRSIWLRHEVANFKQRLKALDKHISTSGAVVTLRHRLLHWKRSARTIWPVARSKRYQQTSVDTYSKAAFAELCTTKTPITSADMLSDQVLPFFAEEGMSRLRLLTDRGTEYCGKLEQHDYQPYLVMNDIEHARTQAQSPQTNGICECFYKTILQKFYQVMFHKKLYQAMEELQQDLDAWIAHYNHKRTHQGKMCCGRTPMEGIQGWRTNLPGQVDQLNLT